MNLSPRALVLSEVSVLPRHPVAGAPQQSVRSSRTSSPPMVASVVVGVARAAIATASAALCFFTPGAQGMEHKISFQCPDHDNASERAATGHMCSRSRAEARVRANDFSRIEGVPPNHCRVRPLPIAHLPPNRPLPAIKAEPAAVQNGFFYTHCPPRPSAPLRTASYQATAYLLLVNVTSW